MGGEGGGWERRLGRGGDRGGAVMVSWKMAPLPKTALGAVGSCYCGGGGMMWGGLAAPQLLPH